MARKLFIQTCIFLLPVIVILGSLEWLARSIPSGPKAISKYLETHSSEIEVLVLGASQNQAAINPEFMEAPTINLASGHQSYNTDFALLRGLHKKLPKLHTVIIPMTFAHFDTQPNDSKFWKNAAYLHFYNVNTYGRKTYIKDRLLYLSNPSFYTRQIIENFSPLNHKEFGTYGYRNRSQEFAFARAKYRPEAIDKIPLSINNTINNKAVIANRNALKKLVRYCTENELNMVILLTPVTKKHYNTRNPEMVKRRDFILNELKATYENISIIDTEADYYSLKEFNNHNHLSHEGAKRLTRQVSDFIKKLLTKESTFSQN